MPSDFARLMLHEFRGRLVDIFDTPLCTVLVASKGGLLQDVMLASDPEDRELFMEMRELLDHTRGRRNGPSSVAREVRKHLGGEGIPDYSDVILDPTIGTDFRRRVWEVARTVPYGETRSYKWLAGQAGRPRAYRAAGSAMANNRFGLVVPCHRIIASDGSLGGFGGASRNLAFKEALLALEWAHRLRQLRR